MIAVECFYESASIYAPRYRLRYYETRDRDLIGRGFREQGRTKRICKLKVDTSPFIFNLLPYSYKILSPQRTAI